MRLLYLQLVAARIEVRIQPLFRRKMYTRKHDNYVSNYLDITYSQNYYVQSKTGDIYDGTEQKKSKNQKSGLK